MPAASNEFSYNCPLCNRAIYLRVEHVGVEVPCPHCGESWTASPAAVVRDPVVRAELFGDEWVPPPGAHLHWRAVTPAPDVADGPPEATPPVTYKCARCSREMELRQEHADYEVPCPFCGFLFTPSALDVIPAPRRQSVRIGTHTTRSSWALALGIIGILTFPLFFVFSCCAFPLLLCGPIGLSLVHKDRADARARGRREPSLETAWLLNLIVTVFLALAIVGSLGLLVFGLIAANF